MQRNLGIFGEQARIGFGGKRLFGFAFLGIEDAGGATPAGKKAAPVVNLKEFGQRGRTVGKRQDIIPTLGTVITKGGRHDIIGKPVVTKRHAETLANKGKQVGINVIKAMRLGRGRQDHS